ncbi:MAG: divalent-cation tolerance protein CutA [Pseudomonadota bacterium]
MKEIVDIWVNCPSHEVADRIAERLLSARLAAATNQFAEVISRYVWKGKLERATEIPLRIKTRRSLAAHCEAQIRDLHPYETPSIQVVAIADVNVEYLEWVYAETAE